MRVTDTEFKVVNAYAGMVHSTTVTVGGTDKGLAIDTRGFNSVMAILTTGQANGTSGDGLTVNVAVQESATIGGTAGAWSAINDGAINGTMTLSAALLLGTTVLGVDKAYERLDDSNRKRYIRAAVSIAGSAGQSITPVGVAFLLYNPSDTLYINSAATYGAITDTLAGQNVYGNQYNTYL